MANAYVIVLVILTMEQMHFALLAAIYVKVVWEFQIIAHHALQHLSGLLLLIVVIV